MNKEESNKLADEIMELGGIWVLIYRDEPIDVVPVKTIIDWTGWKVIRVRAIQGTPFKHMVHDGEVSFVQTTSYKFVMPENLTRAAKLS